MRLAQHNYVVLEEGPIPGTRGSSRHVTGGPAFSWM